MATTKILVVHDHLDYAINYVSNPKKTAMEYEVQYVANPEKTEQLLYCDVINCRSIKTACKEMQEVKRRFSKEGGVQAYHIIQSFAPGEITPDETHAVGMEFAEKCFGDKFQMVVATHLNCNHLHNHILVNSVGCFDGHKYHSNAKSYYEQIRAASDQICREHELSVIVESKGKGKNYAEWRAEKNGQPTMRGAIRADVDEVLAKSINWQTFTIGMQKIGYEVKFGPNQKYATVKHIKGKRAIRLKSLGEEYTEEAIRQRFAQRGCAQPPQGNAITTDTPKPQIREISQYPALQERKPYRRAGRYKGTFPPKAKIHGFMACYYRYLYLLGKAKKKKTSRRTYFLLREDFQKFNRYLQQCDYLWENHIENSTELSATKSAAEQKLAELQEQRRKLYNKKRCVHPDIPSQEIAAQAQTIAAAMKKCRKEIGICTWIESDVQHLQEQLAEAQRYEQEEREKREHQNKQQKREMRFHEQRR